MALFLYALHGQQLGGESPLLLCKVYGANYFTAATVGLKFQTGFYILRNEGWVSSKTREWLYGGHSYRRGKNCSNGR